MSLPSYAEAMQLLSDPHNCFEAQSMTKHIYLMPKFTNKLKTGIHVELDKELRQFSEQVDGILVAYSNIKRTKSAAVIFEELPQLHFDIKVDVVIFKPKIGSTLRAIVNKIGHKQHIGCLVHNCFNAMISKPYDLMWDDWEGSRLCLGQEFTFEVTQIYTHTGTIFMRGKLTETSFEILEAEEARRSDAGTVTNHHWTLSDEDNQLSDIDYESPTKRKKQKKHQECREESSESTAGKSHKKKKKNKHSKRQSDSEEVMELTPRKNLHNSDYNSDAEVSLTVSSKKKKHRHSNSEELVETSSRQKRDANLDSQESSDMHHKKKRKHKRLSEIEGNVSDLTPEKLKKKKKHKRDTEEETLVEETLVVTREIKSKKRKRSEVLEASIIEEPPKKKKYKKFS